MASGGIGYLAAKNASQEDGGGVQSNEAGLLNAE